MYFGVLLESSALTLLAGLVIARCPFCFLFDGAHFVENACVPASTSIAWYVASSINSIGTPM